MKIIIVGAGKVGFSVAEMLSREGHDITIIDNDPDAVYIASNRLDVICVEGSATNPETLTEAGAAEADLLLAATEKDEVNMVCGIAAGRLGTKHVIARIRDPEYLRQTRFLREVLGLSVVVNPEFECAKEIGRMLRFPTAVRVDTFSKGSLEIVEYRVGEKDALADLQLKELPGRFGAKVLVTVAERDGEAFIPKGDFTLRSGDMLSISGSARELRKFFSAAGRYKKPVKTAMIMGGGRITVYLANLLEESGINVTVIEKSRDRCELLCDLIPKANIVCGDATKSEVLLEEGVGRADAFVALAGDDSDNIITSLYARSCGAGKTVTKVNREHFSEILTASGLESTVTPSALVAQQLSGYVRAMSNSMGSSMETMHKLADGQIEAMEFKVAENSRCTGTPLKELKLKDNVLITAIIRGEKTIIPDGGTVIQPGDHAVIVCPAGKLKELDEIVERV